jgi:hypothetical protein
MYRPLLALALLAAILAAGAAKAAPVVVKFSFLNTTGNVAGRVAGHLVFEGNGSNIPATGIYIDSSPAGGSFYPADTNLVPQFQKAGEISVNRFTLVKGVVKKAIFSGMNEMDQISFGLNAPGGSNFLGYGGSNFTRNEFGFIGVDYSEPGSTHSVPEPAAVASFILGLGAVYAAQKSKGSFLKKRTKKLLRL